MGFDSTGAPFALQLAAPAGQDGFLLSLGLALEKLFGAMPPPPTTADCSGCSSNVFYTNVGVFLCCYLSLCWAIFNATALLLPLMFALVTCLMSSSPMSALSSVNLPPF